MAPINPPRPARTGRMSGAAARCIAGFSIRSGGPPRAATIRPVLAGRGGLIGAIDTRGIGLAVVAMGGGRTRAEDEIDHAVGLTDLAELGARVEKDTPLAFVYMRSDAQFEAAERTIRAAYSIGETAAPDFPLIAERITDSA
jgi:thymidine phosphorylase